MKKILAVLSLVLLAGFTSNVYAKDNGSCNNEKAMKDARYALNVLADGTSQYDYWYTQILKEVAAGNLDYKSIGTTQKAIFLLLAENANKQAVYALNVLANGTSRYEFWYEEIGKQITKAKYFEAMASKL